MGLGGKAAHINSDLPEDFLGGPPAYAGDLIYPFQGFGKRAHPVLDLLVQPGDLLGEKVNVPDEGGQHQALVGAHYASWGFHQLMVLVLQAAAGKVGQLLWVSLPLGQGFEDFFARFPMPIGGHVAQLDACSFQHLLDAVYLSGLFLDEASAVAQKFP